MNRQSISAPRLSALTALFLLISLAPLRADEPLRYLSAGKPDAAALLPPPPLPGSAEQAIDMRAVVTEHKACTPNEAAIAFSEKEFSIFNFAPAIGTFFQPGKFPKTEAFFHRVQTDAETTADNSKLIWKRPRPFMVDPSLGSGILEESFSYPSGHGTEGMVLALILADLFPDKHDGILAVGRDLGWHRIQIARHYPTDIYAGRTFAQAIVREMKSNPDFQRDLAEVQSEVAAARPAARAAANSSDAVTAQH